jgi:A/G-specific adenine glycosylase
MLQQTTVPHATPYFLAFTRRWPTVAALARADDTEVLAAWAGLGYYARARNLIRCAREVSARGGFPSTAAELKALPGIGAYTSGAIAALAFDQREAAIDGNVERVFARVLALDGGWAEAKKTIATTVAKLVPADRPGAFAEALMDLGATLCTPKRPNCSVCPISRFCLARKAGQPEAWPKKPVKAASPQRHGIVWVLMDGGEVLFEQRPDKGLLGGMLGLPTSAWVETGEPLGSPPAGANWQSCGEVRHVFTHFSLMLEVRAAQVQGRRPKGQWLPRSAADGLPTVFRKAFRLASEASPISARRPVSRSSQR